MNVVSVDDVVQFQFHAAQSGFLMRRITAAPTNPFLITQCTAPVLVLPNLAVQNTPGSKNGRYLAEYPGLKKHILQNTPSKMIGYILENTPTKIIGYILQNTPS